VPRDSVLPRLELFEGLKKWGEVRLIPTTRDNSISVELRRYRTDDWKPIFAMISVDGRIACRLMAEKNDRVLIYDDTTHTFSDVVGKSGVGNNPPLRSGEAGENTRGGKDNT
jgi:hypothetical protein